MGDLLGEKKAVAHYAEQTQSFITVQLMFIRSRETSLSGDACLSGRYECSFTVGPASQTVGQH